MQLYYQECRNNYVLAHITRVMEKIVNTEVMSKSWVVLHRNLLGVSFTVFS